MKLRSIILLFTLLAFGAILKAQDSIDNPVKKLFYDQISLFPQEKIYVQTDKSEYLTGETIWFRAHLVDAVFLKQANASRYVYVELVNPMNHLVQRVKLRPDSTGCFYGNIETEQELGEGNYLLRAYTRVMQNIGEDYFFTKAIYIANPISERVSANIKYHASGSSINAEIQFFSKFDNKEIRPDRCVVSLAENNTAKEREVSFKEKIGLYYFSEKEIAKERTFQLKAEFNGKIYKKYYKIPYLNKTFDVSFFPEGGYAPIGTTMTMAFKSINSNGLSEDVKGQIFDDQGQLCREFETTHLGMGSFNMYYAPGKKYYAVCTNKENVSKKFNLPEPSDSVVSLKTSWVHDKLYVNVLKTPNYKLQSQSQLIAHIRGVPVYAELWDSTKNYIVFDKDFFPAGIVHFLLVDSNRNILSERLVFSAQKSTFTKTVTQQDKDKYKLRDKINLSIKITDDNNEPLSGNVSIAVVDSKKTNLDTTSSIVSTLLLSSELKGYIENPMSYLQINNKASELALDVLMMTQGWRRYDIPNLLKGNPVKDMKYPLELSEEVSGKAEGVFSTLKEGNLSLLALKDSVLGVSFTKPDKAGKFIFKNLEYPEGTKYIIQANTKTGSRKVFLEMDTLNQNPSFKNLPRIEKSESVAEEDSLLKRVSNAAIAYDGLKNYDLAEVTVTAKRKLPSITESPYYSVMSSSVITTKEIDEWHLLTVYDLLRRIPGVTVSGSEVMFRGNTPMLLLDNVPTEGFDYNMLSVSDIQDAFVTPGTTMGAIFGSRGANGAIVINTKRGFVQKNTISSNIKYVKAIGYQQPTTFYSPAYEREEDRKSKKPDYRTTIYWNPNVQIGLNGIANLSFFAADNPSDYIVIYEGVSKYGHLIHSSDKLITVSEDKY
ncbi:TonB-dependent receptor plug domain-containing protein [Paludibacter propionicigenes]|nr:TonB-dependent receptor plug domain-containing protein [Paludibacter propionicigenes]